MIKTTNVLIGMVCVVVATAILIPWSQEPIPSTSGTATVRIDGTHTFSYALENESTALNALTHINMEDTALQLRTKTYTGLGDLVESMYGKTNGTDERYWQYLVNGSEAQVGAGAYVLKDGDVVEWLFKAYSEREP